jgi:hypothetical protein
MVFELGAILGIPLFFCSSAWIPPAPLGIQPPATTEATCANAPKRRKYGPVGPRFIHLHAPVSVGQEENSAGPVFKLHVHTNTKDLQLIFPSRFVRNWRNLEKTNPLASCFQNAFNACGPPSTSPVVPDVDLAADSLTAPSTCTKGKRKVEN